MNANQFRSPMPTAIAADENIAEQTFFADPAVDRLMGVVMNLATEVFVLRERCAAQEAQLAEQGLVDVGQLSAEPDAAEMADRLAQQQDFVSHLLEPLKGTQVSRPVE